MHEVMDYADIFDHRGDGYDRAMTMFPHARSHEFNALIKLADIQRGAAVCDVPSGGGYLADYLKPGAEVTYVENSNVFFELCKRRGRTAILAEPNSIPRADGAFDRVLSLAALHHNHDPLGFIRECARVLKPGGALCIADVEVGSPQDRFLNGFIDRHAQDGHQGAFIGPPTADLAKAAGLRTVFAARQTYPWEFESRADMLAFCGMLFGVHHIPPSVLLDGIGDTVGFEEKNGKTLMNWGLYFIKAVKA